MLSCFETSRGRRLLTPDGKDQHPGQEIPATTTTPSSLQLLCPLEAQLAQRGKCCVKAASRLPLARPDQDGDCCLAIWMRTGEIKLRRSRLSPCKRTIFGMAACVRAREIAGPLRNEDLDWNSDFAFTPQQPARDDQAINWRVVLLRRSLGFGLSLTAQGCLATLLAEK